MPEGISHLSESDIPPHTEGPPLLTQPKMGSFINQGRNRVGTGGHLARASSCGAPKNCGFCGLVWVVLCFLCLCVGCLGKGGHDGPFSSSLRSLFSVPCPAGAWRVTWSDLSMPESVTNACSLAQPTIFKILSAKTPLPLVGEGR